MESTDGATGSPKTSIKSSVSSSVRRGSPAKTRASLTPQDKGAVVLDIGHAYTRIGMSGEAAPRFIIKSNVAMRPYGEVLNVWDPKYLKRDELYLIMCRFLSDVYLKYLLINPREYRVVIVEDLLSPAPFRNTLAKALFQHFMVPNVCFFPLHLSCLFTLGKSTALIVDIGHQDSTVLPVYEGVAIVRSWQATGSATEAFQKRLTDFLKEEGSVKNVKTGALTSVKELKELSLIDAIPNIAVKTCFVRPLSRGDQIPPDIQYSIDHTHSLTITGHIRSRACDVMFDGSNDSSVAECVLDSVLQCSIDTRKELVENLFVIGGGACLPGFNWRLKEELERLLVEDSRYCSLKALEFKFHKTHSNANYTAWQGGSIFGSFESAVLERSVSRETFKQKKCLPDWMSCDSNQWETLQNIPTRKLPLTSATGYYRRDLPVTTSTTTTRIS